MMKERHTRKQCQGVGNETHENPIDKPFKTIEIQVPRKHQVLAFITRCSTMVSSWEMTFPTRVPSMAPITATDTTKPQGMLCSGLNEEVARVLPRASKGYMTKHEHSRLWHHVQMDQ